MKQLILMSFLPIALLQPPLNLTVVASQDGRRLAISWLPNPLNAGHTLLGYKLVWDLPSRVVQSAVDSVRPSVREYTTYPVDLSAEYSVLVWAYNTQGDGQPAKAEWSQQCKIYDRNTIAHRAHTPRAHCSYSI